MTIAKLPSGRIIHGGPRIIRQPIPKAPGTIRRHIVPESTSDTFIKPNNASFAPLLPFHLSGMQNQFNEPPVSNNIGFVGTDGGLALNPIKKSNKDNR